MLGGSASRTATLIAALGGLAGTELTPTALVSPLGFAGRGRGRTRIPGEQQKVGHSSRLHGRDGYFVAAGGVLLRRRKKLTGSCPRGYEIRHW